MATAAMREEWRHCKRGVGKQVQGTAAPAETTNDAATGACKNGQQWQGVLWLMEELQGQTAQALSPTPQPWVPVRRSEGRQWQRALQLTEDVQGERVPTETTAYTAAIPKKGQP